MERIEPRSLPGWTLGLWREILFPGPSSARSERGGILPLVLLLVLPAVIL